MSYCSFSVVLKVKAVFAVRTQCLIFRYDNDPIEMENFYLSSAKKEIKQVDIIDIPDILCMVNITANYNFCLSCETEVIYIS